MICNLCGYQSNNKNDFFISGKENPRFECAWELEKTCKKIQYEKEKIERERLNKLKADIKSDKCTVSDDDLQKMSEIDQFECKYKLNYLDLELDKLQYRDASRRYTHKETGEKFIFYMIGNYWTK